jgi:hypothetical protein
MSNSELSPTLRAALHRKLVADMQLMKLQQDMDTGKRVFSASAMLSALENCDDATGIVWDEVGQALRKHDMVTAETNAPTAQIEVLMPTRSSAILGAMQQRVRQLFIGPSKAPPPLHPNSI